VEKPIATGVTDWRALCELERTGGTRFAVNHQLRWHATPFTISDFGFCKCCNVISLEIEKRAHNPVSFATFVVIQTTKGKETGMNRQHNGISTSGPGYRKQLLHAMVHYLPHRGLPLQTSDGRVRWSDRLLAMTAVLMVWSGAQVTLDAFGEAREVVVSMYKTRRRPGRCLSGFLTRLRRSTARLLTVLVPALQKATQNAAGKRWQWGQWILMAVDGSRINCPRTKSNEQAFGCAGRKKTGPQQFLTTVFHVSTGLLWDWRGGPGNVPERTHLRAMLPNLPAHTLLLADAGFTGYDLLKALLGEGQDFLVRVGANVTLLRKLGYFVREHDQIVYLWPQNRRRQEPMVLRLVRVRDGRKQQCLLTSILDPKRLSDSHVAELYRLRWRVEVCFRSLKQTMGKRTMLSTSAENAKVELDWAVVGLWLLSLMGVGQAASVDRHRLSVAQALRAVRRWMRSPTARPPAGGLHRALRKSLVDRYARTSSKKARDWPHKKQETPPGVPKIRTATKAEVLKAKEIQCKAMAA
jgi:hypothetical protein